MEIEASRNFSEINYSHLLRVVIEIIIAAIRGLNCIKPFNFEALAKKARMVKA